MFRKLQKPFVKPIYAVTEGLKTFMDEDRRGIDYKKIWSPDAEEIYNVLPKKYWKDFHLTVMTINCEIPPHTDTEIITSINFYLQTGSAKTVFYEPIVNKPKTFQVENQTNGFIYCAEDLREVSSFVAEDLDVWVLDVTKIHSVKGDIELRKAITLGTFIHSYDDVLRMLKETGNVC